ncbi:MAG: hypothetical protein L6V93_14550 [Clostridiales bacterium]|nr:MAG: hypothetical protein L6V93_14550 [Clostridiales bacterium]
MTKTETSHRVRRKILNSTPMGRFGETEELTGTLLWLFVERRNVCKRRCCSC